MSPLGTPGVSSFADVAPPETTPAYSRAEARALPPVEVERPDDFPAEDDLAGAIFTSGRP